MELAGQHASDKTKDYVTLETRRGKEELDAAQVRQVWNEKLDKIGFDIKEFIAERGDAQLLPPAASTVNLPAVQEAVQAAISIAAGDKARFSYNDLLNLSLNRVPVGQGVIPAIRQEIDAALAGNTLVALDEHKSLLTSRVHLQTELEVQNLGKQVQGDVLVKLRSSPVQSEQPAIQQVMARNESIAVLSSIGGVERQVQFLEELAKESAAERRKVTIIGANKSFTEIFADKTSFKGSVVQRDFIDSAMKLPRNGVLIVSEAEKLSLQETKTLLESALRANAQVLLVDTEGRRGNGNAMSVIKDAGISVYENSRKQMEVGVSSISSRSERSEAIAQSYVQLYKDGAEVVAQAGNRSDRKQLTTAIRSALIEEGIVRGPKATLESLEPVYLTGETRKQRDSYRPGQVLEQWDKNSRSVTRYRIINVSERANSVQMEDAAGNRRAMKPKDFDTSWSLYNSSQIEVAEGDKLRSFSKDRAKGLEARDELTVIQVKNGKVLLQGDDMKVRLQDGETVKVGYNYAQAYGGQVKETGTVLALVPIKSLNAETLNTVANSGARIEVFTAETVARAEQKIAESPRYKPVISSLRDYAGADRPDQAIQKANQQLYGTLERDIRDGMQTARGSQVAFNLGDLSKAVLSMNHQYQLQDVRRELDKLEKSGELLRVDTHHSGELYIERNTYLNERNILAHIAQGKGAVAPLMGTVPDHLSAGLTLGQREASALILTTPDRFVGIQGYAGVGKTTQFRSVLQSLDTLGGSKPQVIGLAPTHQAVQELQSIGVQAQTISSFLVEQERMQGAGETSNFKNTLFLIDEQSMVGNDHLSRLYDQIAAGGGRAVSSGDTAQLQAISPGAPFRLMQTRSAADFAIMKEIVRQSPELLPAVHSMIDKDVHEALRTIQSLDPAQVERKPGAFVPQSSVMAINDNAMLYRAIAEDYAGRTDAARAGTIVVAHTNADRTAINSEIHDALKAGGQLGSEELVVPILVREKTTGSQLNNAATYEQHVGQVLLMRENYYVIEGADMQSKTVALRALSATGEQEKGAPLVVSPAEHRHSDIAIFRQESIRVSEGEKIRFTATNKEEGIFANRPYSVVEIGADKSLVLQDNDGGRLTVQAQTLTHQHLDYAYAVTAFGAQGSSHPYVIALEGVEGGRKHLATLQDAYVAISRAKEHVQVYSDNPNKWASKVAQSAEKATAHDLLLQHEDRQAAVAVKLWGSATPIDKTVVANPNNLNMRWMGSTHKHPQPSLVLPTFNREGHQVGVLLYDLKPGQEKDFSPNQEYRQLGSEQGNFVVLRTSSNGKTELVDGFNEVSQFTTENKETGVIVRLSGKQNPLNPERISGGSIIYKDKDLQELNKQLEQERRDIEAKALGVDDTRIKQERERQPLLSHREAEQLVQKLLSVERANEAKELSVKRENSRDALRQVEREIVIDLDKTKEKSL